MTDSEKLARWQGWKHDKANLLAHCKAWIEPDGITRHDIYPDYLNDEAAAMSLLDTLVEKDYVPQLAYNGTTLLWQCAIDEWSMIGPHRVHSPLIGDAELGRTTRRAAVVAAVLELIGREDV